MVEDNQVSSQKIAVASSDGKNVNMHMGKASCFLIFQKENNKINFLEVREKQDLPIVKHSDKWMQAIKLIEDVDLLICSKIGPEPYQELKNKGINVLESSDTIENSLKLYFNRNNDFKSIDE